VPDDSVDLSGWSIARGEATWALPPGAFDASQLHLAESVATGRIGRLMHSRGRCGPPLPTMSPPLTSSCLLQLTPSPDASTHTQAPCCRAGRAHTYHRTPPHSFGAPPAPRAARACLCCRHQTACSRPQIAGRGLSWTRLASRSARRRCRVQHLFVGPEQRAVREAPARPPQGAVQAACGACEGLAGDASTSRRVSSNTHAWQPC
jgi:hypothetical protein